MDTELGGGMKIAKRHTWQFWVENEHYSIAYFDYVTTFKALYLSTSVNGGAHMCCTDASICEASTQRVRAPPLMGVQRYFECSDAITTHDGMVLISTWDYYIYV